MERAGSGKTPITPDELLAAIHDKKLEPEKKADLVQRHSMTMMKNLFENPSAKNIKEVKQAASDIVDLILRDAQTTFFPINNCQPRLLYV